MRLPFFKPKNILFATQTSMFSSTLLLASMMLFGRGFGFVRQRVMTGLFTPQELDLFWAAFKIPDIVFEILVTGALSTTFVPFFVKYQKDKESQSKHISTIINVITIAMGILIIVLVILMRFLLEHFFVRGFSADKIVQVTLYSRILLIGQLPFLALGNIFASISQAKKIFLIPAVAPIFYNVGIIVTTILFSETSYLNAPILGTVIGSIFFFLIQLPIMLFSNFSYRPVILLTQEFWSFVRLTLPRVFTTIVAQIDSSMDLFLSSYLASGSYTVFNLAKQLYLLPISVIGMAFGGASLPYMTELYQTKQIDAFKKIVIESILAVMFFVIPITSLFMFMKTPLVRVFFGGECFNWQATNLTADTLFFYVLSMPLHTIYYFLVRCFYAIFNSRIPFYIGVLSMFINICLSLIFIFWFHWQVDALALAFTVSISLNTLLLLFFLSMRLKGLDVLQLVLETAKISVVSIITSVPVYYLMRLLDRWYFETTRTLNVIILISACIFTFTAIYLLLSWVFNVRELNLIAKMLLKAREYQQKIIAIYTNS